MPKIKRTYKFNYLFIKQFNKFTSRFHWIKILFTVDNLLVWGRYLLLFSILAWSLSMHVIAINLIHCSQISLIKHNKNSRSFVICHIIVLWFHFKYHKQANQMFRNSQFRFWYQISQTMRFHHAKTKPYCEYQEIFLELFPCLTPIPLCY